MSIHLESTEQDLIGHCSVCGHIAELFGLPGRTGKSCLACSADVATTLLLTTEIDAATLAGQNTGALIAELGEISNRVLSRAQSASRG